MGNLKIVVINGQGGVGKDLFIDYCNEFYDYIYSYSTVEPIKRAATKFGWKGTKEPKDRKMLSELKQILKDWGDVPYKKTAEFIEVAKASSIFNVYDEVLFIHCREPEEIERLKKDFDVITLLIRRPEVEQIWNNKSDDEVFDYFYDYVIINNSKEELKESADFFINEILEVN